MLQEELAKKIKSVADVVVTEAAKFSTIYPIIFSW